MEKFLSSMKSKFLAVVGLGLIGTSAFAEVTFTGGSFSGSFDLAPYYSAIGIIVTAIAVVAAIRLALTQFRRVG